MASGTRNSATAGAAPTLPGCCVRGFRGSTPCLGRGEQSPHRDREQREQGVPRRRSDVQTYHELFFDRGEGHWRDRACACPSPKEEAAVGARGRRATPQHVPGVPLNAEEQLPPPRARAEHPEHPSVDCESLLEQERGSGRGRARLRPARLRPSTGHPDMAAVARRMWVAEHVTLSRETVKSGRSLPRLGATSLYHVFRDGL